MSAASILRKIAIAFHYGATAIAAAFFLMSFCWIGGFLGLLVETMNNPAASPHYMKQGYISPSGDVDWDELRSCDRAKSFE
jgi:hypothetical protein